MEFSSEMKGMTTRQLTAKFQNYESYAAQERARMHGDEYSSDDSGDGPGDKNNRNKKATSLSPSRRYVLRTCLQCLKTTDGRVVPRPLGHHLLATHFNEVLHFDYVSTMGKAGILILVDGLTGLCSLTAHMRKTARQVTRQLLRWFSYFGLPDFYTSDRGSHFLDNINQRVAKILRINHVATPALMPHINGRVERFVKETTKTCQKILSENGMNDSEWSTILPVVQYALNTSRRPRLGNRSPMEVAFGKTPRTALRAILYRPSSTIAKTERLKDIDFKKLVDDHIKGLTAQIDAFTTAVHANDTAQRSKSKDKSDRNLLPNLQVGDYVLVKRLKTGGRQSSSKRSRSKMALVWSGPHQIVDITNSPWIFMVKPLLLRGASGKEVPAEEVHINRMLRYADSKLHVTESLRKSVQAADGMFIPERIVGHLIKRGVRDWGKVQLQVKWRGFEDHEQQHTWERCDGAFPEDQRSMVLDYLNSNSSKNKLIARAYTEIKARKSGARPKANAHDDFDDSDSDYSDNYSSDSAEEDDDS